MESSPCQVRLVSLVLLLALPACGFHLQGRNGGILSPEIESIAVPPFANRTGRPELEQRVTEELLRQLQTRSRRRTSAIPADADAVLVGEVSTFRSQPVEFNPDGRARTIQVVITARARLLNTASQEVIWASDHFVFRENYDVGQEATEFVDQETIALQRAAVNFAEAVVTSILEGF